MRRPEELMRRIAELNAIDTAVNNSNYLYEKDVYDPDSDPDLMPIEEEMANDAENGEKAENVAEGFELPDFLKDIEDGIIKIQ